MSLRELNYPHIKVAANSLAKYLAKDLHCAILARGKALLAVSGGRTPQHVFTALSQHNLDWKKVDITLTDERWVDPTHEDSNEKLVRDFLLQHQAASATFIQLYTGDSSPETGQKRCERRLQALNQPFDAVYLGMGEDGHFASLFPREPAIDVRNTSCVAIPATSSRQARMSLSVPRILNSQKIYLLIAGQEKLVTYQKALTAKSHLDLPIQLLLAQSQVPIDVLQANN